MAHSAEEIEELADGWAQRRWLDAETEKVRETVAEWAARHREARAVAEPDPIIVRPIRPQLPTVASWQQEEEARELLAQGYHRDRVASRVGVDPQALRHLVADDGYGR